MGRCKIGLLCSKLKIGFEIDLLGAGERGDAEVGVIRAADLSEALAIAKDNPEFAYRPTARIEVRSIKTDEESTGYVYPTGE